MKEEGQQHQEEATGHLHGREQIEVVAEAEIDEKNEADQGQHHHGVLHLDQ